MPGGDCRGCCSGFEGCCSQDSVEVTQEVLVDTLVVLGEVPRVDHDSLQSRLADARLACRSAQRSSSA